MRSIHLLPLLLVLCEGCSDAGLWPRDDRPAAQPLAAHRLAQPAGPVLDAANIIEPADEAKLAARLTHFHEETGHALVVVTAPNLGGEDVVTYTDELANRWGVGSAERNDGIVLLVAPKERNVRIATGFGMEKRVPDELAARIIRDRIIPHFRRSDWRAGIEGGVDALTAAMVAGAEQAKQ